eukprot:scaffold387850_cov36-Prasinocladus_malaysianus.AAC.1
MAGVTSGQVFSSILCELPAELCPSGRGAGHEEVLAHGVQGHRDSRQHVAAQQAAVVEVIPR